MPKLNDLQTILLSAAAQRDNQSLYPLPQTLTGTDARISKALVGLTGGGWAEERETEATEAVARTDGDSRYGLFITAGGLAAIGLNPSEDAPTPSADERFPSSSVAQTRPTKSSAVISLLTREQGATLPELITATGWLPHTTRAALTGLRKKGHAIERFKRDESTCYRIEAAA